MGWAQRSRRYLSPATICYLCDAEVVEGQEWNRDHVPPQRFFGKAIRDAFNPNLSWLADAQDRGDRCSVTSDVPFRRGTMSVC